MGYCLCVHPLGLVPDIWGLIMVAYILIIVMVCITLSVLPAVVSALINIFVYSMVFISALWSFTFLSVFVADKLDYLHIIPPFIANIFVQIITLGGLI